ncbi:hypothetical protein II898_08905 [bacterium]|nr:hypothetical protein [bacterium]
MSTPILPNFCCFLFILPFFKLPFFKRFQKSCRRGRYEHHGSGEFEYEIEPGKHYEKQIEHPGAGLPSLTGMDDTAERGKA